MVSGKLTPACPCGRTRGGSVLGFDECCGPLVRGELQAGTAEQLMRSRYTAYALGELDHVFRTWHPRTRPADLSLDPGLTWLGLRICDVEAGSSDDDTGTVEFIARYRDATGPNELHERSTFARRAGRWVYVAAL